MANIQPKKKSVIQKGTNFSYNPDTFIKEHKVSNFFEVSSAEEMIKCVQPFEFKGRRFITFDTETYATALKNNHIPKGIVRRWVGTGKSASPQDYPFCISICDGKNAYTLFDTEENNFAEFKKLSTIFEDDSIEKIAHNTKYDMHMLANIGMKIKGKLHDTVVVAKLANENRFSFALMDLAAKIGGIVKFEYMVDAYKKQYKIASYRQIPKELLTEYANADVWNCYLEFITDYEVLEKEELLDVYENELKVMMVFWVMERFGMKSDKDYEKPLKDELQQLTDAAEQAIYDHVGYIFNVNSGKQLYKAMLDSGVDKSLIQISDKGNPVLDKDALNALADVHGIEIVKKVLEFRKYEKLLGTYAMGIYDQRDAEDKVHCSINQTEATTGRTSITKPALQTLPKKDKRIRRVFIPSDEYDLVFMDLDQVEYRGFAHYAQAWDLIEAINKGHDVHTATAAIIFNVPIEEVTDEMRGKAKTINFGLIYGQGVDLTATSLKMSKNDAYKFRERYFAAIPAAKPFIDTVQSVIKSRGYIKNFYGRRRRLKSDEAYKGPNALIQGWAADYAKTKMVMIFAFLMTYKYKSRLVNFVHDELVQEIHNSERHIIPKLRWMLSEFKLFRAHITAGVEYGNPSWGEKVEPEDVGFEPLSDEELEAVNNYNFFDGSIFDYVL